MPDHVRDRFVTSLSNAANPREVVRILWSSIRTLRITPLYAAMLLGVWAMVSLVAEPRVGMWIVHHNSTNVANLMHGRLYTLVSSAFVLARPSHVLIVGGLVVVLGLGELVWGWARVAGVFLFGHVVATLVVFAGLATGIALNQVGVRLAHAADVGVSYGLVAVVGGLLVYLPLRRRRLWQLFAVGLGVAGVLLGQTFTDAGHLTALLLGFAAGHALRRGLVRRALATAPLPSAPVPSRLPAEARGTG